MNIIKIITALKKKKKQKYKSIRLDDSDIENQTYKRYFGGRAEKWESRGAFQLYFLKKMGLLPSHKFLSIGCGPCRAGTHFITYLNEGNYYGIDYNKDFLKAAEYIINKRGLTSKKPRLHYCKNFNFPNSGMHFDFVLVFSVLNSCDDRQRKFFFRNAPKFLKKETKLYITHAQWFMLRENMLHNTGISVSKKFNNSASISHGLDMSVWGYEEDKTIFPILELKNNRYKKDD
ncbi:MAG: class I SAM-dependent methyltransferase [Candidatus Omnitrophica bacterium]|nr:class I SAM-dependent methyltransferase [Candidatus Omnitrophota bacterium]